MDLNLVIQQTDRKKITVLDYSTIYRVGFPDTINEMTLDIVSEVIDGGKIDSPLDLIAYLTSERINDEIYIVTPQDLKLSDEDYIKDGLYKFTYAINSIYVKEISFISILEIQEAYAALLAEVNYSIDISTDEVRYTYDTAESQLEEIRIISALIEQLEVDALSNDEARVLDSINKLQTLLQLA